MRTAPEAPAMPAPGEPGPGPSAVLSVPLHGPVDVVDDSLEGLQSAFRALSVEEVDTNPVKRKRKREKDAGESMADEGVDHEHDPTSESTLEVAPSASGLHASPSPTTTTLPTPDPAATTSTPIATSPMAECVISQGIWASQKLSGGCILDLSKLQDPGTLGYLLIFGLYSEPTACC